MAATQKREVRCDGLHQLRRAHHHEIRGALNALRLQLTLIQRGRQKTSPDDPRFGQWVEGAVGEADAVERAFGELSDVEHIHEIDAPADPLKIGRRVVELLDPLAKTRRVGLTCEAGDTPDGEPGVDPEEVNTAGLARALLEAGAERLVAAENGDTVVFRVGSRGVDLLPDALHIPYDQPSERAP